MFFDDEDGMAADGGAAEAPVTDAPAEDDKEGGEGMNAAM
jgi:hypothetical protein